MGDPPKICTALDVMGWVFMSLCIIVGLFEVASDQAAGWGVVFGGVFTGLIFLSLGAIVGKLHGIEHQVIRGFQGLERRLPAENEPALPKGE